MTIVSDEELTDDEIIYLQDLTVYLDIPSEELEESLTMTENFLLHAQHDLEFMKDSTSYEKGYSRLSKRWGKILMRNKDKLGTEIKQSKDLIFLVKNLLILLLK